MWEPKPKVFSRTTISNFARAAHQQGRRIVWTNGCFDLLHAGHVDTLNFARAQGDLLIVGLNSDLSIRELKGPGRPIVPEAERATVLAGLECVDYVTIFRDRTPAFLLTDIKPHVYVKGAEPNRKIDPDDPEQTVLRNLGIRVIEAPYRSGLSTTALTYTAAMSGVPRPSLPDEVPTKA